MLEFADPWFLLFLVAPFAVYVLVPARRNSQTALVVPETVERHIMSGTTQGFTAGTGQGWLAPIIVWVLLVIAFAGPRVLAPQQALPMSGRDLVLALDLSGSMVRDDFSLDGDKATRLEVVKTVAAAFVRARAGDRVGVVVFGSDAYVAAAPSFDTEAIAQTIEAMVIGISGRATNISDGIGISLKRLQGSDAQTKVIILLSDGANNAGATTPRAVAGLANQMGVRVHTIALGPVAKNETSDQNGVVDVQALQDISTISGGQMFRVRTTEDLRAAAATLEDLEPTARAGLSAQTYREFWIWPALLAGCISLGMGLRGLS